MMDDAGAPLCLSPTGWIALAEEQWAKACGPAAASALRAMRRSSR